MYIIVCVIAIVLVCVASRRIDSCRLYTAVVRGTCNTGRCRGVPHTPHPFFVVDGGNFPTSPICRVHIAFDDPPIPAIFGAKMLSPGGVVIHGRLRNTLWIFILIFHFSR